MSTLSVVIVARDEERNIEACLESVRWADELILVDAGSSDNTVELARRFNPRVLRREWEGFGPTKEFGVAQAAGDWILSLDADERVTPELAEEIREVVRGGKSGFAGYMVRRRAYFLGRWMKHGGWYPGWVIRLFRRGNGLFDQALVHEQIRVSGSVGRLSGDLIHLTDPDLGHYLRKFNRFTSLGALQIRERGRSARPWDFCARPPLAFLRMFILKTGFLDGTHGLLLALLSSTAVLIKYAKLWELEHYPRSQPF